jgi:hypothetical protein
MTMGLTELLVLLAGIGKTVEALTGIAAKAAQEGRDPTADELATVKQSQSAAEAEWASLAPKQQQ